ncbi:GumC family protein [Salisaeta longa]|uniref:GumC family protein n=1 Tax=Salisaeta longa TaxID=503170 RepID=UPI0003B33018|nr:AAA family ATPase [Salisaeta longa]
MASSLNGTASSNGTASPAADQLLYDPQDTGLVSVMDRLRVLWQYKWIILAVAFVSGTLAYVYVQSQPKQYQASAIVLLSQEELPNELLTFMRPEPSNQIARELYFLRNSASFAQAVAQNLRVQADSVGLRNASFFAPPGGPPRSIAALGTHVHRHIRVVRDDNEVPALRINATTTDPQIAALLANTVVRTYRAHLRRTRNAKLRNTRRFLNEQQSKLRAQLRTVEDSIAAYIQANGRAGLLRPDSSGALLGGSGQLATRIFELKMQKDQLQVDLKIEQALLDSSRARLQSIRPLLAKRAASTTTQKLRNAHERLINLQMEVRTVRENYETLTPALEAMLKTKQQRIDALQQRTEELAQAYVRQALSTDAINPISGEQGIQSVVDLQRQITEHRIAITRLKAQLKVISEQLQQRRASLQQAPDPTLARLKRRKAMAQELFLSLSKSLQQARVAEESQAEQAHTIRRATAPSMPSAPNVWRIVLLGTLLGTVCAGGSVLVFDRMDDIVDTPNDLKQSSAPLFGTIPQWADHDDTADTPEAPSILVPPFSAAAEAYRHVATNIRLGIPDDVGVILVTSPGAGEGKTTTAINLGMAFCETGHSTLVLDADLYNPNVHRRLHLSRTPGLSDLLAGAEAPIHQIVDSAADQTANGSPVPQQRSTLGALTAGNAVPQPSLLLQETHFCRALDQLHDSWDMIIIDTPPALFFDSVHRLAAISDVALVIASAGATHQHQYQEVIDRFTMLDVPHLMGMLNRYDGSTGPGYGYGYTYGTESYRGLHDASNHALPLGMRVQHRIRSLINR